MKFLKWLRLHFHRCSGSVIYKYEVKLSRHEQGKGNGLVTICVCDVCKKPFATLETVMGREINIGVAIAIREALTGPRDSFKESELGNLLNLQAIWGL